MPQGLTLVNLLDQAVKEEAAVNRMTYKDNKNFKRISCFDSSQESSYLVLIVDSGFSSSFYDAKDISHEERYALDEVRCALKGCELPRLEELLALHIFRPDLAQEPRRGSVFWSCSNTFSLGKKSAWGIEHYISEDNYRDGFTTIQICTYDQSLRPYSFEPPHSCQGVIRFSPSKK
jgi:hypothetical protein